MTNELRPEEPDYPARLRRIREQLDEGLAVYVDHCEFATSKKMVLVRATALTGADFPVSYADYLFVSWLYNGSTWFPMDGRADWSYVAEKLQLDKWPGDAKSIAAFVQNLAAVGSGRQLVIAKDMP